MQPQNAGGDSSKTNEETPKEGRKSDIKVRDIIDNASLVLK
jgi:hypothetical protein